MIWESSYKQYSNIGAMVALELRNTQQLHWQELYSTLQKYTWNGKLIISFRLIQIISYETPWLLKDFDDCH